MPNAYDFDMLYPRPQRIERAEGEASLPLPCLLWLRSPDDGMLDVAEQLSGWLSQAGVASSWTAYAAPSKATWRSCIQLQRHPGMFAVAGAYRLSINDEGVSILASDDAGLLYGACTLRQLLPGDLAGGTEALMLPKTTIVDWPDIPHRGVMLDISRDRVPTLETLFGLVDLLASWKVNQLQLYMEHTFAYAGHEMVWRDASPLRAAEIRRAINRLRAAGGAPSAS